MVRGGRFLALAVLACMVLGASHAAAGPLPPPPQLPPLAIPPQTPPLPPVQPPPIPVSAWRCVLLAQDHANAATADVEEARDLVLAGFMAQQAEAEALGTALSARTTPDGNALGLMLAGTVTEAGDAAVRAVEAPGEAAAATGAAAGVIGLRAGRAVATLIAAVPAEAAALLPWAGERVGSAYEPVIAWDQSWPFSTFLRQPHVVILDGAGFAARHAAWYLQGPQPPTQPLLGSAAEAYEGANGALAEFWLFLGSAAESGEMAAGSGGSIVAIVAPVAMNLTERSAGALDLLEGGAGTMAARAQSDAALLQLHLDASAGGLVARTQGLPNGVLGCRRA